MLVKLNVLGARSFNDTVEGVHYDFTKLIVEMPMPTKDTQHGADAVQMPWGNSMNYSKIRDVQLPAVFELDVNMTTKGYEIMTARVVAAPAAPAARPAATV